MFAYGVMGRATSAALGWARASRLRRRRLAVIKCMQTEARLILRPGPAVRSESLFSRPWQAGGGTRLRLGLAAANNLLQGMDGSDEDNRIVLITDGRTRESLADMKPAADLVLVDAESGPVRLGGAQRLAAELRSPMVALADFVRQPAFY